MNILDFGTNSIEFLIEGILVIVNVFSLIPPVFGILLVIAIGTLIIRLLPL